MKVGFLVTNGGAHPADKWADLTTDTIMDLLVDGTPDNLSDAAAAARQAKRDLRPKLFDILNAHHSGVQNSERTGLAKAKKSQVGAEIDVAQHMGVADQVDALFATTPWAAHFAQESVKAIIHQIIGQHTADVMHIERKWHEDGLNAAKGA